MRKIVVMEHFLPFLSFLGKRLRNLRIAKGFTSYAAFAKENGISKALYGRYEQGKDLRLSSLSKIVKVHNMTLKT